MATEMATDVAPLEDPHVAEATALLQQHRLEESAVVAPAVVGGAPATVPRDEMVVDQVREVVEVPASPAQPQNAKASDLAEESEFISDVFPRWHAIVQNMLDHLQCEDLSRETLHDMLLDLAELQAKGRTGADKMLDQMRAFKQQIRTLEAEVAALTKGNLDLQVSRESYKTRFEAGNQLLGALTEVIKDLRAHKKVSMDSTPPQHGVGTAPALHASQSEVHATSLPVVSVPSHGSMQRRNFAFSKLSIEGKDLPLSREAVELHWDEFSVAASLQGYTTFGDLARVFATTLLGSIGKHYAYKVLLPYVQALEDAAAKTGQPLKTGDAHQVREHFVKRFTSDARTRAEESKDNLLMGKINMEGCTLQQFVSKFEEAMLYSIDTAESDKVRLFQLGLRGPLVSRCAVDNENRKFETLSAVLQHAQGEDAKLQAASTARELHAKHQGKPGTPKVQHRLHNVTFPSRAPAKQVGKRKFENRDEATTSKRPHGDRPPFKRLATNLAGDKITKAWTDQCKAVKGCFYCGKPGHSHEVCPHGAKYQE